MKEFRFMAMSPALSVALVVIGQAMLSTSEVQGWVKMMSKDSESILMICADVYKKAVE
jgi:hypothetical protein